jgi:hypothetical protein
MRRSADPQRGHADLVDPQGRWRFNQGRSFAPKPISAMCDGYLYDFRWSAANFRVFENSILP